MSALQSHRQFCKAFVIILELCAVNNGFVNAAKEYIEVNSKSLQAVDLSSSRRSGFLESRTWSRQNHTLLPHFYRSGDRIIEELSKLVSDEKCGVPSTATWEEDAVNPDRKLFVIRLGSDTARKRVMLVANTHAREAVTAEVAADFVQWACAGSEDAKQLFADIGVTVLPILNLGGRRRIDNGRNPCQRATVDEGEGEIDLNRNMDVDFEASEGHGPRPFSTYQTRVLRSLAEKEKPLAYVDLHSGYNSLMVPWGSREYTTPDFPAQRRLLDEVSSKSCPKCEIGSNCKVIGYRNPGEIMDHMYQVAGIKYSTLWEIYQGNENGSCIDYFNPTTRDVFHSTVGRWTQAVKSVAHYVRDNVGISERSIVYNGANGTVLAELVQGHRPTPTRDSQSFFLTT
jgi:hypothetical protein|mmetsp:Transcript_94289/g.149073  ORF Transcript_94289/g.149073 Transcript_94289/m.149073 type:complete len:399 (-) Transcript_94289:75-1271(-)